MMSVGPDPGDGPTPQQIVGGTDVEKPTGELLVEPNPQPETEQRDIFESAFGEVPALIPGTGEGTEKCGDSVPQEFCDEAEHIGFGRHLCGRKECPRCWSSQWSEPRTTSVAARLQAARWLHEDGIDRRVIHASVSAPGGEIESVAAMFEMRSKVTDIVREHGIRGGVVIVHPYRPMKDTKKRFKEAKEEGFNGGIWRFIRENERHWYSQVYWSPHYHIIGLCRDLVDGSEREDEWVIQNLSTGRGVEPNPSIDRRFSPMYSLHEKDSYEDVIGTVRYLLSHTAAVENRQSVTWFGALHSTNFAPDPESVKDRRTEPDLGPLSGGGWSTIQRVAEEIVGVPRDEPGEGEEEEDRCSVEGCEGHTHPIWEVPAYIDHRGDDLSVEALVRLRTAFAWAIGDSEEEPEGGWPSPRSDEEAEKALEQLL